LGKKYKIVLGNLGSPKSPKVSDVRFFLKKFLGDPRVVDINPILWKIILNLFVLPFRPKRSAAAYARIWKEGEFPLIKLTRELASKIRSKINDPDIEVNDAHLLASPSVKEVLDSWQQDYISGKEVAHEVLVIPLFPQYSESTTASAVDLLAQDFKDRVYLPSFRVLNSFHHSHAFIEGSVRLMAQTLKANKVTDLVITFHGIPKRRVIYKYDPYYRHCFESFDLMEQRLRELYPEFASVKVHMTFQSRFGSEEWLTPYTDGHVQSLAANGSRSIALYCASFIVDCLESIDEIGGELREEMHHLYPNTQIHLVPCLNDEDEWCDKFAEFCKAEIKGSAAERQAQYIDIKKVRYERMEKVEMQSEPLSKEAKSTIKIVFLTLFLDLMGFSIIFPLFPALAKYYLELDPENIFLKAIFNLVGQVSGASAPLDYRSIVLFGGALGALYSLLQFIAAPLWGSVSDKIGRKPVLLISVLFMFLSYLMWGLAGSFTWVVAARFIGGIMGGNISTATAAVADVTSTNNRSRGMAFVGMAFAFGFILGPALGGIFSTINLLDYYPSLVNYGVNPFSMPAFVAMLLSFINLFFISKSFKETLPESKRGKGENHRIANPLKLFKPLPFKGINLTNWGNFSYLLAFSGMEFTLTFLAFERFQYSSMDNAYMFIFIGFILAIVQGGVVRRSAHKVGEKKMALIGLVSTFPGLLLIAFAQSSVLLYAGLFFLSIGAGMLTPCLTSLASLYTPSESQGLGIGVFRSLGALARVFGPLMAAYVYFHSGSSSPYIYGSIFLILPLILLSLLPQYSKEKIS
jgi:ferrochelatase